MTEKHEYYFALAQQIFFNGITDRGVRAIGGYKEGKTFEDVKKAVSEGRMAGLGDCDNELFSIANRLEQVIKLDTKVPLLDFKEKLYS